jgi:hypothetical protein
LRNCRLKKVAELRMRTFKIWLPQTLSRLCPVSLLSSHFSSARDGFKKQPKIFLKLFVSMENKTCLKGTVARDFCPPIFFLNQQYGTLIHNLTFFLNSVSNSQRYSNSKFFPWGLTP